MYRTELKYITCKTSICRISISKNNLYKNVHLCLSNVHLHVTNTCLHNRYLVPETKQYTPQVQSINTSVCENTQQYVYIKSCIGINSFVNCSVLTEFHPSKMNCKNVTLYAQNRTTSTNGHVLQNEMYKSPTCTIYYTKVNLPVKSHNTYCIYNDSELPVQTRA